MKFIRQNWREILVVIVTLAILIMMILPCRSH